MNDQSSPTDLCKNLSALTTDLWWMSESDYPFSVIDWENVTDITQKLREIRNCSADTKIEVRDVEDFFQKATQIKDWYGEDEMSECQRYQSLVNWLKTHLKETKVYRVGEGEVHCFVLGKTENETVLGISTISIET